MKKIGIFFAPGYEEIEGLTVVDLCRRAGIDVTTVAVGAERVVEGSHRIPVTMDVNMSQADFDAFDMIVLPGGMPGTKNLEACEPLMAQVDAFYQSGKYIAAICAAPSILGHRGILQGRKACCYPSFEDHLTGAEVTDAAVSVDGKVITSRGMGCAIDFALAIITQLCGKEEADKQAASIIYR